MLKQCVICGNWFDTKDRGSGVILKMDNKLLISSKELSEMLSVSEKWVIRHRHRIVGAQKVGSRLWRFNRQIIEKRIAQGQDIVSV